MAFYKDGTDVGDVALFNEVGGGNRPPRPFMLRVWNNHFKSGKIKEVVRREMRSTESHNTLHSMLASIGDYVKNQIEETIEVFSYPPNAPSTIKKKGRNDPLVDTGIMKDSVIVEIKTGKGGKEALIG